MTRSFLSAAAAILLASTFVFAQDNGNQQDDITGVPAGMEARKVSGGVTVLMPKGGKMYKRNQTTYIEESSDQYSARNFSDVYKRLTRLEEENRTLFEEIRYLKSKMVIQENSAKNDAAKKIAEE